MTANLFKMCLYDGLDHGLYDKSVQLVASKIHDGFYVRPLTSSFVNEATTSNCMMHFILAHWHYHIYVMLQQPMHDTSYVTPLALSCLCHASTCNA